MSILIVGQYENMKCLLDNKGEGVWINDKSKSYVKTRAATNMYFIINSFLGHQKRS